MIFFLMNRVDGVSISWEYRYITITDNKSALGSVNNYYMYRAATLKAQKITNASIIK